MSNYIKTEDSMYKDKYFKPNDTVKMYKEGTGVTYPMVMLTVETLEAFRIKAMQGVLYENPVADTENYSIYVRQGKKAVRVGYLPTEKLGYILHNNVFSVYDKKIYLDKETIIEGDMMYALCPPSDY